jgi:hypothetical protein
LKIGNSTGFLEKTGWKIITREKFTHPVKKFGFALCCGTLLRDIIWFTLKKLRTKISLLLFYFK